MSHCDDVTYSDRHIVTLFHCPIVSLSRSLIISSHHFTNLSSHCRHILKYHRSMQGFCTKPGSSGSSTKPGGSKNPLYHLHFPNHPTSQSFSNYPVSYSSVKLGGSESVNSSKEVSNYPVSRKLPGFTERSHNPLSQ